MKGFTPGLMDKLMDDKFQATSQSVVKRLSIEEIKDTVARDLESLLNTRAVIPDEVMQKYPECSNSIITYGLNDFAGMSLASTDDRAAICRSLERSITRHEPRLRNVKASLELQVNSINRLSFSITALLVVNAAQEPVNFDAVLQPSSLQYSISKAPHTARIGV
ncbi:MAG: type VI secretion system baseplate subunit TssE [Rhodoferax sp.]|uniref:type VI secretion system baseplate subunit TssE n=1 Tax=Rhodoferax sp. TaxID=50421 RepID=UPI00326562F6